MIHFDNHRIALTGEHKYTGVTGTFKDLLYFLHDKAQELGGDTTSVDISLCQRNRQGYEVRLLTRKGEEFVHVHLLGPVGEEYAKVVDAWYEKNYYTFNEAGDIEDVNTLGVRAFDLTALVRKMKIDALTGECEWGAADLVSYILAHQDSRQRETRPEQRDDEEAEKKRIEQLDSEI